uniref:ARC6 IMS domain-containing protein n=1 Tax=Kalanchoe fedtschenkoi TaxID=63787 RepID=A0A7N0V8H9_KALFE
MAFPHLAPTTSSASFIASGFRGEDRIQLLGLFGNNVIRPLSSIRGSRSPFHPYFISGMRNGSILVRSKLTSPQLPTADNLHSTSPATLEIPVTCYQIIGLHEKAEKDEIAKSVMVLKSAEVEEGYTADAIQSRQEILMDVRDKLLFEPEYAGNVKDKIPPKSRLRIPWAWLPGALCLLQEVGEEKLVLDIGRTAIQHLDAKPYIHDLLLSMALAECSIAKAGFEKNNISQGFEALARAQCLLRSKISLGKMTLLSQIEESLEELAPVCTLDLLGISRTPENAERRRGAISALRELLRQGLDVEATCEVEDWSCFLSEALRRLLATEVVNLLPWDGLAVTRKNKKSIESQNQKVVIDFNCFYMVMIAYLALGFSSKQLDLVHKANIICECLMTSDGVDLKLEESVCLFLKGQGNEAEVAARIQQLEKASNSASRNLVSPNEARNTVDAKPVLELWLEDAVLSKYPDTRDCSPSLVNFFKNEKKQFGNRKINGTPQAISNISHRPLSTKLSSDQRTLEDPFQYPSSFKQFGSPVQQLTQVNMQTPLLSVNDSTRSTDSPTVQLKRTLGANHDRDWKSWIALSGLRFATMYRTSSWASNNLSSESISLGRTRDTFTNAHVGDRPTTTILFRLKELLTSVETKLKRHPDAVPLPNSCLAASLSSSMTSVFRKPMPLEEAEALVKQWQAVKAEALGPNHQVHSLSEVLDESMLLQWQDLADAAIKRSCFWRFVMLQLSIIRADITTDSNGVEMAEIEALLEEAAELVDQSQPKHPNYYSTYKILYILRRQKDGLWRFCESDIETLS